MSLREMEIRDIFVDEMAAWNSRRGGRYVYRPFVCVCDVLKQYVDAAQ